MKAAHLSKITHVSAIALGLGVALLISRKSTATSPNADSGNLPPPRIVASATNSTPVAGSQDPRLGGANTPKFRSAEYRRAWAAIADQDLPSTERHMLQFALLQQWAEVDLEAAMTAAFDTSWDSVGGVGGIRQLMTAFQKEFKKRPTESWDLIASGKFGLGGAIAKNQWAKDIVGEHPLLVANVIDQIPFNTRGQIFSQIVDGIAKDPSKIGEFYDKLASLPSNNQMLDLARQAVEKLGARGTPEEIRAKFLETTTDTQRTMLVHEFGKSLAGASLESIQAQLAQMPEDVRGRMLRSISIHAPVGGENTPQLVEMLLKAGEYGESAVKINEHLREYSKDPAKQAPIAQWAVNLPEIPGSSQVVHRAVGPYFAADPQGSRAWLETLPNTRNRNLALAEYSQQMLYQHTDPEASAWALEKISDPKIKQDATNWRSAWAKKTGQQK